MHTDLRIAANGYTFDRLGRLRKMGKAEAEIQRMGIATMAPKRGQHLTHRDYEKMLRRFKHS